MKRLRVWLGVAVVGVAVAVSGLGVAYAQPFSNNVKPGETVNGSLYTSSSQVRIRGTVNGDIYCAGQQIIIDAIVHGDVLCTGFEVRVNGRVDGNVRVAAMTVEVGADVGNSVSVVSQKLTLTSGAKVGRDLSVGASVAHIQGNVGRDVRAATKTVEVKGAVGRDLTVNGTNLTLQNGAKVAGNLEYTSINPVKKESNAKIAGTTTYHALQPKPKSSIAFLGLFPLIFVPILLAFAMVLVALFPKKVNTVAKEPTAHPFRCMFIGAASVIVVPVALLLLSFSILGIFVAMFVLAAWFLIVLLSGPITAYYIGSMVLSRSKNPLYMMAMGSGILLVIFLLPAIAGFAAFEALLVGSGAIFLHIKHTFKKPVYRVE